MIFPLTSEERVRLQKLALDKTTVFAFKKLFMNNAMKGTIPPDVQVLAAERIALDILKDSFRDLENIQPDNPVDERTGNLI